MLAVAQGVKVPQAGSLLIGEKGTLLLPHVGPPKLLPAEKFADVKTEKVPGVNHYVQWADACRGEGKTTSHFDYAGPLTEAVLLGTVAIRVPGETVQWDTANLKVIDNPAADRLLRKAYRKGWEPGWVTG